VSSKGETQLPDIALVQMPFATAFGPALGLSLLKAALERRAIGAAVYYPAVWFADQTRNLDTVRLLIGCGPETTDLAGEWVFSEACFGPDPAMDARYVADILRGGACKRLAPVTEAEIAGIDVLRDEVPAFLDRCMSEVDWGQYRIVGFSTSFQQTLASVALANRIKERYPRVLIAFGGANCEGEMGQELFRQFPCIDLLCSGEGDTAFPEAVSRCLRGEPIGVIPGILHRDECLRPLLEGELAGIPVHTATVADLDALPYPDFDDYFSQYSRTQLTREFLVYLFFETSRGCWWGEKSHCTFCGLNGSTMAFRSKNAERALAEIAHLKERYGHHHVRFHAVDNILDYKYMKDFLPALRSLGLEGDLFYEIKTNLSEAHVALLARAGIRQVQPGVDSLSTPILQLMRKGATRLQNIQLLKWCAQYGITPHWNILTAFPQEPAGEYQDMAALIPWITHLMPPTTCAPLRFDRFSPYFYAPEAHGVHGLRASAAYRYVFRGIPEAALFRLAYYFDGAYANAEAARAYTRPLDEAVNNWREVRHQSQLNSFLIGEHLYVQDSRPVARAANYLLTGLERLVLEAASRVATEAQIGHYVSERSELPADADSLREALLGLMADGLLLQDGNQFLSIVVPWVEEYCTEAVRAQIDSVKAALRSYLSEHGMLVAG
jgi:ribosomal peptide maturation radical SAM protein 1